MPDFIAQLLPVLLVENLGLFAALLGAGACAGILAGLFGVGGGIVIVPALFTALTSFGYAPDLAMHIATGTSLATIIPTGLSSARAHYKRGSVDMEVLRLLAPSTAIFAFIGAFAASGLGGIFLTILFAIFAALIALLMLQGKKGVALVSAVPKGHGRHVLGGGIGLLSAMLGIGGGTMSVPTLAACGYKMTLAVGTGSALGLFIALPGALGFVMTGWGHEGLPPFSLGYVNMVAMAIIAPLSVVFAPLGAKFAHKLPELWLRRGFAVFLLLMAAKMAMKAL